MDEWFVTPCINPPLDTEPRMGGLTQMKRARKNTGPFAMITAFDAIKIPS